MSARRIAWRAVGVVATLVACAPLHAQPSLPTAGRWVLDRSRSDDPARAVDSAVADLNRFVRPMARGRLGALARAWPELAVERAAPGVRLAWRDGPVATLPLGDSLVAWRDEEGRTMRAALRRDSVVPPDLGPPASPPREVLVLRMLAPDGGERRHVLVLDGDGATLVLHVRIASPRLARAVRYRLVHRRAP